MTDTEYKLPAVIKRPYVRKFIAAKPLLALVDEALARQEAEEAARQEKAPDPRTFTPSKTARGGQVVVSARDERVARLRAEAEERDRDRAAQRAEELALLASVGAVVMPRAKPEPVGSPDTEPSDLLARMKKAAEAQ